MALQCVLYRMLTDIYAKASIYQTLYEIDKKRKKYEQAILYNDTALVYYDSIQKMVHHTEINSLIKKHSTEMYEQRVESQYQKDKAVLIICILLTISFAIFILMYISNRNKIKYIYPVSYTHLTLPTTPYV